FRRSCFAAVLVSGSVLALSTGAAAGEARAASAAVSNPRGPYLPARSLALSVPDKLKVGRRDRVGVEGFARAGDTLSVFVDRKCRACADSASTQPPKVTQLIFEV